jgi:hypothetical protein
MRRPLRIPGIEPAQRIYHYNTSYEEWLMLRIIHHLWWGWADRGVQLRDGDRGIDPQAFMYACENAELDWEPVLRILFHADVGLAYGGKRLSEVRGKVQELIVKRNKRD